MEAEKFEEWRNNRPAERLLEIGERDISNNSSALEIHVTCRIESTRHTRMYKSIVLYICCI